MGTIYQHYKGGIYELLYEGKHTETGELLVIYKDMMDTVWVRPIEMFHGLVELAEGNTAKRFTYVGDIT